MNLQMGLAQTLHSYVWPFLSPLPQFLNANIHIICVCVNILIEFLIIHNGADLSGSELLFRVANHYLSRFAAGELLQCRIRLYLVLQNRWCLVTRPLTWYSPDSSCLGHILHEQSAWLIVIAAYKGWSSRGKLNATDVTLTHTMSTPSNRMYPSSFPSIARTSTSIGHLVEQVWPQSTRSHCKQWAHSLPSSSVLLTNDSNSCPPKLHPWCVQ